MEIEGFRDVPKYRPYRGARAQPAPGKLHSSEYTGIAGHPTLWLPPRPQAKSLRCQVIGDYGDSLEVGGPGPGQGNQVAARGRPR